MKRSPVPRIVLVVAMLALVGCGVHGQSEAEVIPAKDVPFGLSASSETPSTPGQAAPATRTRIYFIRAGHLVPAPRDVAGGAAKDMVSALAGGPSATESSAGLRSAIGADVVSNVSVTGDTATVDLSNHFGELPRGDQLLGIGQLVYTLSELPGIDQFQFRLDERPTAVPTADGTLSDRPVTRDDYRTLLA